MTDLEALEAALVDAAGTAGLQVTDRVVLPARPRSLAPLPEHLHEHIRSQLQALWPDGLYRHQADALSSALDGRDVVLSTATASGKSLIFMTYAAHLLLQDPRHKILALYPAKALIHDQLAKWSALLGPLGFRVGLIHGGIGVPERQRVLSGNHVTLMTPDVVHAWLMSRLTDRLISLFLDSLRLVIMDEAHVYDGAFGTNMAYLLRRLQAVSGSWQLICSTATLSEPLPFFRTLTGRDAHPVDSSADSSASPEKSMLVVRPTDSKAFDSLTELLRILAEGRRGRFVAFGDSRKLVERVVATLSRGGDGSESDSDSASDASQPATAAPVLPYRAGYEEEDRQKIQAALESGALSGVVSTSALELGIDIGDIDVVVLLTVPHALSSFWQRIGRMGRRKPGVALIVDSDGQILTKSGRLSDYLLRPIEGNHLYLANRYIQYAHALCAARELRDRLPGKIDSPAFASLPKEFGRMLSNEIHQTEALAPDLYALKQRALEGPSFCLPPEIRS